MVLGFSFTSLEELGSKTVTQDLVSKSKIFASSKVGRNGQRLKSVTGLVTNIHHQLADNC